MNKCIVVSLYDFTGEAVMPWAKNGYECHCYDIQHEGSKVDYFSGGGSIHYLKSDLHKDSSIDVLTDKYKSLEVAFGMAFPVCTDLAVSGAAWFKSKAQVDPMFQVKAVSYAVMCSDFFTQLGVPFFVENPVSVLATKWRKPDLSFHPYDFGGYIPESESEHPTWPEYIAPKDAYKKKTCLWVGGGFVMPQSKPVEPEKYHGNGYSTSMMKLGGKSQRTKNIRSATPRGFSVAVYEANKILKLDNTNKPE